MEYKRKLSALASLFFLPAAVPLKAQHINGTRGSPKPTQSIDGQMLPAHSPPFSGAINLAHIKDKAAARFRSPVCRPGSAGRSPLRLANNFFGRKPMNQNDSS
jgi:hypothetical protein